MPVNVIHKNKKLAMRNKTMRPRHLLHAALIFLASTLAGCSDNSSSTAQPAPAARASTWLPVWSGVPTDAIVSFPLLPGQVFRQFIAPHADGDLVRLKLSNRVGQMPVSLAAVTLGLQADGAALREGSVHTLTFNGEQAVTIPAGETVLSDPLPFPVRAFEKVAVSFAPASPILQTARHFQAREVPFFALAGATPEQVTADGFVALSPDVMNSWLLISGLEVQRTGQRQAVVALGDSITDGFISTGGLPVVGGPDGVGEDARYPDFLARRLLAAGNTRLSVVNAGLSGNRVSSDGSVPMFGPSLLKRLQADVLDLPNVRTVILLEGINDLGMAPTPDTDLLIRDLEQVIRTLKAKGIRVLQGTLMPARGTLAGPVYQPGGAIEPGLQHGTAEVETARQQVNTWIRSKSPADGVIDFDACMRDADHPAYLRAEFDSGDHLHPNVPGYQAMANCVDMGAL